MWKGYRPRVRLVLAGGHASAWISPFWRGPAPGAQRYQAIRQGTTSQLLVLCNRTAVHNQLLQHGFQTSWRGGLRVSTSSSAAGATALILLSLSKQVAASLVEDDVEAHRTTGRTALGGHCCADTSNPAYIHCLSGRHGWSDRHGADASSLSLRVSHPETQRGTISRHCSNPD